MPRETPKAREAWADYLALGDGRSLAKLAAIIHRNFPDRSPDGILRQLKTWSAQFGWQGRLDALAAEAEEAARRAEADRRREILETGFALDHERVLVLKDLTQKLVDELQGGRLWLKDRKVFKVGEEPVYNDDGTAIIGSKAEYEVYDFERPNSAWVTQVRGLLSDIADERGGRVKKTQTQITGKDDGPLAVTVEDTTPRDQRLADVAALVAGAFAATRPGD